MDDDDDFALADSFINFDYAAAYSPTTTSHLPTHPDLTVRNSGVQERFQSFSLVENEVNEIQNGENRGGNDDNAVEFGEITGDFVVNDGEIRGESEIIIDDVNEISEIVIDNDDNAGEITIEINDGEIRGQTEIIINGDDISEIEIENDDDIYEIEIENDDDIDEIEIESTTESESESSSSSSESEDYELEEGEIVDSGVDDSEDGSEEITSWCIHDADDNQSQGRSYRSRNDLENLHRVPPVNVNLGPHHKMLPVGVVTSIVDAKVIVEGVEKHAPLNEGSILWITERKTPLGLIDEIFGQVTSPYYVVRYNSENEVPKGIREGTLVSFVAEFVNHVLDDKDLYEKGYDEGTSDEAEFSDDEKEAEYKRMQKQNKRGPTNRNLETRDNNRKKVPPNNVSIPMSVAPAAPLVAHGHCRPPMSGTRQDIFGAAHGHSSSIPVTGQGFSGTPSLTPPFPPVNGGPNLFTTGVTNGAPLPPQQPAVPTNGFPTNGVSWHPENTHFSHQLPTQGIPFQQQFNPSHRFPPPNVYPSGQPNMYAQGPMNQNQQSPFPQFQAPANFHRSSISGNQGGPPNQFNPPTNFDSNSFPGNQGGLPNQFNLPTNFHSNSFPGNQGGLPNQFNPPTNFHSSSISGNQGGPPNQFNPHTNFHSNSFPGNQHTPQFHHQFNPGAYDGRGRTFGRGRKPFHRGGRGWRPDR